MFKKLEFIKPTTLKVMGLFFAYPMERFHQREVSRKAGISPGSSNKILRDLSDQDILLKDKRGRMVFYQLNATSPFVKQFKILFNLWELKDITDSLRGSSRKIALFGSCAQGNDTDQSDIDLFILTEEKRKAMGIVSEFNRRSERRISPIIFDSIEFAKMRKEDEPLYEAIMGGIVLWEMQS